MDDVLCHLYAIKSAEEDGMQIRGGTEIDVTPPSRPFAWALRFLLRKQACKLCTGPLEVVWLEWADTGRKWTIGYTGGGFQVDHGQRSRVTCGYRCTSCSELFWRNGKRVKPEVENRSMSDASDGTLPPDASIEARADCE